MWQSIRNLLSYWIGIIRDAAKATGKIFDVRGNLIAVLIYIVILLLISGLLANGIFVQPIFVQLTGDLTSEIRLGIALLIVLIVLFVGNLIYVPAKRDREQRDLIDYHQNRHVTPKLRVRAINRENWVGIEVFNMEDDVRLTHGSILIKDVPQLDVLTNPICLITQEGGYESFQLAPKLWNTLLLAELSNGSSKAHIISLDKRLPIGPGVYNIAAQLDGRIEYNDIRPIENEWELEFDQTKKRLELRKIGA